MTSVKVKFRPSSVADREGTIYYQIIHGRSVRQLLTDYKVLAGEWSERRSMVVAVRADDERGRYVSAMRERIRHDVERLLSIVRRLEAKASPYVVEDVIDEFDRYLHDYTLTNFMERIIVNLKQNGRLRTAETYRSALNSFRHFLSARGGDQSSSDVMLDCITSELMESFEAWHRSRGIAPNTISFYMRILRAVYNRAVDGGVIDDRRPFRHVYTGVDKTVKRALPIKVIRKIKMLDLSATPSLCFARDMFMMSFYLRGMSFIDMAFLRKDDLHDGYVTYRRRKTGQRLVIEWTREMQHIVDCYPESATDYLLPIIRRRGVNERCAYRNASYNINHHLKTIARLVGIAVPLTLYVARHSWASAAKTKGIPLGVISEGMGHDSEATTRIYLASLDSSVVDRANSLILASL